MIETIKTFVRTALEASGNFDDIVTTSDERFADFDAKPACAMYAVRVEDLQNLDMNGEQIAVRIRIFILISDWDQQRATEKMIKLHKYISAHRIEFSDPKYYQEDLLLLGEDGTNPEVLVNLPNEHTIGIEYEGTITVDTE